MVGGRIGAISVSERQSRGVQSDVSRVVMYHFQMKLVSDLSAGCGDMSKLLNSN